MDKQYEENFVSSVKKIVQELEENRRNITSITASAIYEVKKYLEKIENHKISEYKDVNNKLSDCAQKAIEDSKGPLKPDKLLQLLLNDAFDQTSMQRHSRDQCKNALAIRKYSDDIDGVRKQISQIVDAVEKNREYRKKQDQLDGKFLKNISKWDKAVTEELDKEKSSKTRQSDLKKFLQGAHSNNQSHEVSKDSSRNSSKREVAKGKGKHQAPSQKVSKSSRNKIQVKSQKVAEGGKNGEMVNSRKRKSTKDAESCSSQDSGVTEITHNLRKRLKFSSSDENTEKFSREDTEPMSVSEGSSSQDEPMSISERSSSQDIDPMSISEASSSQDTELSSVSGESGNEADVSSEADSEEIVRKKKSITSDSGLGEDLLELGNNEETILERDLYPTRKPSRRNIKK